MRGIADRPRGELPPILKWAGGKRWLVPLLRELYAPHRHRRLVEPFVGGMAVALGLRPQKALLNDINPHLINFYRQVQKGLIIGIPLENVPEVYYRHRERFNFLVREGLAFSEEGASLFYYLNRTGFNGLCRFNRQGAFNVPFGKYRRIRYQRSFAPYQELFKTWEFLNVDFEEVPLEPDDFVYADPPYDVEFTEYAPGGFSWEDQVRLAEWLSRHPGPVVVSNQATERMVKLYQDHGFHILLLEAPRSIAANGNRERALELLGANFPLPKALGEAPLFGGLSRRSW